MLVALVITVLTLLYIPPVQDFVCDKVLGMVNKSPGMDVSVGRFRLYFPLDVELRDVLVRQDTDTMISARRADLDVAVLPLLRGEVKIDRLELDSVIYRMGASDSAMWLRSRVDHAMLVNSGIALTRSEIDVDRLILSGGRIELAIKSDTTAAESEQTGGADWLIRARELTLADVDYSMTMMPVIDSLGARIPLARLLGGEVDLGRSRINVQSLVLDSINATYLTPSAAYLADHQSLADPIPAPADSVASHPWTITADSLRITRSSALYGVAGAAARPGLDMNCLQLSDINIYVDSFYNRGAEITVPLRRLTAHERCGIDLRAGGTFAMDSASMRAEHFDIATLYSSLTLDALMGTGGMTDRSTPVSVELSGYLSPKDIAMVMPATSTLTSALPGGSMIDVTVDVAGTAGDLRINDVKAEIPRYIKVEMKGDVADVTDMDRMSGNILIDGHVSDGRFIKPTLVQARLDRSVNLPPLTLHGDINMNRGTIGGKLRALTSGGKIALDAAWTGRREAYRVDFTAGQFPVNSFMPGLGVGRVTADISVNGHGYDPFSEKTQIDATADIKEIEYIGHGYAGLTAGARLSAGYADITASSANRGLDFDLRAAGNLSGDTYNWTMSGDVRHIDMHALGLSDSAMSGAVSFSGNAAMTPRPFAVAADMRINTLDMIMGTGSIRGDNIDISVNATDSLTEASVKNHDLNIDFRSPSGIDSLSAHMRAVSVLMDSTISRRRLDVEEMQRALPPFSLDISAGSNNIVSNYLQQSKISFRQFTMNAANDTAVGLDARVVRFKTGDTALDTITLSAHQRGKFLPFEINIDNRPGTLDQWAHVNVRGYVAGDRGSLLVHQRNIQGRTGYNIGLTAVFSDTSVYLTVIPAAPVIGYKNWTVNKDNFIEFNMAEKHFDADLIMKSAESSVHLYTDHQPGDSLQEDVILKISDVKIADWIALNPFAPPVKGDLSADMNFRWTDRTLNGNGTVGLTDFYYGRDRVGSFDLGVDLSTNPGGTVRASVALMVDSVKTITAIGNINDSTAVHPFLLDFTMIKFPLRVVNPFLPANMIRLSGTLNGNMDITGSMSEPVFNGFLDFDSTAVRIPMLGTTYEFSDEKIPMDSNVVRFNDFTIRGVNENPLTVNGVVDMKSLSDIKLDLDMKARNMQIVGSKKGKNVDVYGKAFVDIDADVKGGMNDLNVDAALDLLAGTNVTYVMTDAASAITSQNTGDMVRFVNFADTTRVETVDTVPESSFSINLDALLTISEGSTINVDLSPDGKNKVSVLGSGTLNYTMNSMNDSRFSGRYNINGGFVRYTPPLMSEKLFNFQEGSYIAFNGDMLNPILNIHAVDRLRANVTQEGQNSRLITFDVGLSVTNSLENMNVAFDLSTDDDITVENELRSMSAEQRANQAMNLLLYNVYTGPGTRASSSLSGNPLFSFLESQLNSWAANNIKGVDISFGIDQYDRTVDGSSSMTTSYSYRVSKSLFNDRFKIVVGGNYSTDTDPDENLSQNLVNDISFEYMLNRSGSMYVKLFRHTGYESILEGEITQTGVGFVYKRKLRRLSDLFRPFASRRQSSPGVPAEGAVINPPQSPTVTEDETDKK